MSKEVNPASNSTQRRILPKADLSLPPGLTLEEWNLVQDFRKRTEQAKWFNRGLDAAIQACTAWEGKAKGMDGKGGEVYANLAKLLELQKIEIVPKRESRK